MYLKELKELIRIVLDKLSGLTSKELPKLCACLGLLLLTVRGSLTLWMSIPSATTSEQFSESSITTE